MNDFNKALELIELDKWDEAHILVQQGNHKYHYLIHALLHRIEGDNANASYWYSRAQAKFPKNTIQEEVIRLKSIINKS